MVPRKGNFLTQALGRMQMRLSGWKFAGEIPNIPKFIMIVAPHTSNWDFLVGVAARAAIQLKISWMGKSSLFKAPIGFFMKRLGGIPVFRDKKSGVVDQVAEAFHKADKMALAITPEGTRSRRDKWKTGFYFMAQKAGCPILPVSFDYKSKTITFGDLLIPDDNFEMDMKVLNAFFSKAEGKNPEDFAQHIIKSA